MSKLLIANWKMNPLLSVDAVTLANKIDVNAKKYKSVSVGIAPAFVHIPLIPKPKSVWMGAQDVFWENPNDGGAFTGEVSLDMLRNIGASFVIIGHSERRKNLGETDEMINRKVKMLVKAKFYMVLCVGEPLSIRSKGFAAAKKYVASQLKKDLKGVNNFHKLGVVAYEPIWAIGTGKSDNPELASEMAEYIKKLTGADVLYGGSVTSKNAESFLMKPSINGALVGGASLNAQEFTKIIEIASKV
ncbi:MAG: triose-phosphate isomerase [bacterium]|nr:triose-phosphate isomerase [bacterium]